MHVKIKFEGHGLTLEKEKGFVIGARLNHEISSNTLTCEGCRNIIRGQIVCMRKSTFDSVYTKKIRCLHVAILMTKTEC